MLAYEEKIRPRLHEIKVWIDAGQPLKQIAKQLDVGLTTFYKAMANHQELQVIVGDRSKAVDKLYGSMMKSAMGYVVEDKETIIEKDGEGNVVRKVTKTNKKNIAPNPYAIDKLLRNWDRDHWGQEHEPIEAIKPLELKIIDASGGDESN